MRQKLVYEAPEFLFGKDNLPSFFVEEIEKFKERNRIDGKYLCNNCLSAHLIKKVKESGEKEEVINKLKKEFKDEIGHHGYYLDGEELVKIGY